MKTWDYNPVWGKRDITRQRKRIVPLGVDFIALSGEEIPLEKNTVERVLVTDTLCSIPDLPLP